MQNYSCKNCGAELYWDPQAGCLKCQFCEAEYQTSDFEDHTNTKEVIENEAIEKEYTNIEDTTENMSVYACENCGGEVVALNTTMATICPYCGEAISITSKSVGDFRPELCIPFSKSKKQIMDIYKEYVNKSFLTPKAFKEQSTIEKIQGLFTPFHLHTIRDKASHAFEGEKMMSRKRGYDKVTTHNVYSLRIEADGQFERIPTDGAKLIPNSLMEAVEPFDYNELKPYNPAYMAGFMAEQTNDDEEEMGQRAETRAKIGMREKAMSSFVGYSGIKQISENHVIGEHESEYVMLPVWMLNVKHGDKKYTFAINGQTGKITGKLPMDIPKLCLVGCGVLISSDIILAVLTMLFG